MDDTLKKLMHTFKNYDEDFIEFDSLINIRPRQNNRSRYVEDAVIRDAIQKLVKSFIQ